MARVGSQWSTTIPTTRAFVASSSDDGYEVVYARSGRPALRALQECPPALVLFDLVMPNQGGADHITACRRVPNGIAPMIAVRNFPSLDRVAAQIGADAFLARPSDLTVSLDTVQAALASGEVA